MKVLEIFDSIQGEGTLRGTPMTFIRLAGCNLVCSYCDTAYAQVPEKFNEMTNSQIIEEVRKSHLSWVYLTGGEPLLQDVEDLIWRLRNLGKQVGIATNGSIERPSWAPDVSMWNIDIKCPSSGPSYGKSKLSWIRKSSDNDEVKFVVSNKEDLKFVKDSVSNTVILAKILISPMIPKSGLSNEWTRKVWNFCVKENYIFSLQEHKIVWGNKRLV